MKTAILILAATILLLNCSSDEPESQEVILQKIYDNSGGKGDATAITMEDLKATGVENLEDARLKQYQSTIAAKKDFSNPATVGELQAVVMDVNSMLLLLNPITPSEEQTNLLNAVFSATNNLLDCSTGRNTYVVKNNEDLDRIYSSNSSTIDFSKYFIIGGKVTTPEIPYELINQYLYVNNQNNTFEYLIRIKRCADCFTAFGCLFYWNIYPLNTTIDNENVSTIFKYIES